MRESTVKALAEREALNHPLRTGRRSSHHSTGESLRRHNEDIEGRHRLRTTSLPGRLRVSKRRSYDTTPSSSASAARVAESAGKPRVSGDEEKREKRSASGDHHHHPSLHRASSSGSKTHRHRPHQGKKEEKKKGHHRNRTVKKSLKDPSKHSRATWGGGHDREAERGLHNLEKYLEENMDDNNDKKPNNDNKDANNAGEESRDSEKGPGIGKLKKVFRLEIFQEKLSVAGMYRGDLSVGMSIAFLSMTVIGSGVHIIPWAIAQLGYIPALALIITIAFASDTTLCMLVRVMHHSGQYTFTGNFVYYYGEWSKYVFALIIATNVIARCVGELNLLTAILGHEPVDLSDVNERHKYVEAGIIENKAGLLRIWADCGPSGCQACKKWATAFICILLVPLFAIKEITTLKYVTLPSAGCFAIALIIFVSGYVFATGHGASAFRNDSHCTLYDDFCQRNGDMDAYCQKETGICYCGLEYTGINCESPWYRSRIHESMLLMNTSSINNFFKAVTALASAFSATFNLIIVYDEMNAPEELIKVIHVSILGITLPTYLFVGTIGYFWFGRYAPLSLRMRLSDGPFTQLFLAIFSIGLFFNMVLTAQPFLKMARSHLSNWNDGALKQTYIAIMFLIPICLFSALDLDEKNQGTTNISMSRFLDSFCLFVVPGCFYITLARMKAAKEKTNGADRWREGYASGAKLGRSTIFKSTKGHLKHLPGIQGWFFVQLGFFLMASSLITFISDSWHGTGKMSW